MSSEVESTGDSYRLYLWVGGFGASGDIPAIQAETFLIEKEFVVNPVLTEIERTQALLNMKEWQCGIFQINDTQGDPIEDPIPYAMFLNNLTMCNGWAITGERNKDGIFHTHAMLRTGARSDSVRRSMLVVWQNLLLTREFQKIVGGPQCSMDCLKLQRCHKPSSMLEYMMKAPQWVMSTDERWLEFMYNIDKWGLNYRFKKALDQPEEHETAPEINQMTKEIIDLIISSGCKTFEDCLRHGSVVMSKYLHRPGLKAIVDNCLQFVKSTGHTWQLALFETFDPDPSAIHKVLLHQGIKPSDFDPIFHKWITKADPKRNCICIQGPSNTGKSAFISGLKQCVVWGEIVNGQTFMFEGLCETVLGFWEEPLCSPEAAEKTKQVLEGMACSIPVKYKKPFLLPRTPICITTNHDLWRFCSTEEEAFKNRMWIFMFHNPVQNCNYDPRAVEPSCQCGYCFGSRGRAIGFGEPSAGELQEPEQPLSTGEQRVPGAEPESDVRAGPMLGAREGPSGSTSSTSSSSDQQCSQSTESGSSTSRPVSRHVGQFRIVSARYSERGVTRVRINVPSSGGSGSDTRDIAENRRGTNRRRTHGVRYITGEYAGSLTVDTSTNETNQMEVPTKAKKPRLGGKMGPAKVTLPMCVPLKEEWQSYLSYLYHWYG
uniref:Nonstructural protein n=1 Tax=Parvoviridae sp. TaxID=1940570 RepID=A0A7D3QKA0_9VIRU|nr:MAG: nonstructural protein [Parvoviridae sp.]